MPEKLCIITKVLEPKSALSFHNRTGKAIRRKQVNSSSVVVQ